MATCALDDLVPSIKCNKITLEPVRSIAPSTGVSSVNFGEYDVIVDASVQDSIEETSAITDYMLKDTFRQNIKIYGILSRDNKVKSFYDFLTRKEISTYTGQGSPTMRGLSPAQKSYLFLHLLDAVHTLKNIPEFTTHKLYVREYIDNSNASTLADTSIAHLSLFPALAAEYANMSTYVRSIIVDMPTNLSIFSPSPVFIGTCIRHILHMTYSDVEFKSLLFEDIAAFDLTGENGVRKQDEYGNYVYDIKIPTSMLSFSNSVEVENCFLHMSAYFSIEDALSQKGININIPLDYETLGFFYNSVDECAIISNKLPASAMVQDFRISERIEEIIRSDLMSPYDQSIDEISLKSSEFNPDNSSLSSHLYPSYVFEYGVADPLVYTKNFFFLNLYKLLKRKSGLSFLYENVTVYNQSTSTIEQFDPRLILGLAEILSMQIYRVRADEHENPVLIKEHNDIIKIGDLVNDAQMYKFVDTDFMHLTDGEYFYEIRMEVKDPMYDAVRALANVSKPVISTLKGAIEYIHNNPQYYNEMRGELSDIARSHLLSLFSTSEFTEGIQCIEALLTMFTGQSLGTMNLSEYMQAASFNPVQALEYVNSGFTIEPEFIDANNYILPNAFTQLDSVDRRKIENFYRICQDLMFGISKFLAIPEVVSSAEENNLVNKKTNRIITYEREWNYNTVKANLDSRMMLGIQNRQREEISYSEIITEYTEELSKHASMGSPAISATQFSYMNFLTPSYIGGRPVGFNSFATEIPTETYVKIIDATLKKPDVLSDEILAGIYTYAIDGYNGTVENLRNDSGVFETVLHEHAVTVKNKTAHSINTDFELGLPRVRENTFGIDQGRNSSEAKFGYTGYTEEEIEAAREELERQQTDAATALYEEKLKKELLIMNCLVDKDAHHLLDRRRFVQGSPEGLSFVGFRGYDFHHVVQETTAQGTPRMPHPRLFHPVLTPYCQIANETTHTTHPLRIIGSRFIVDNTFILFYLSGFDEDMNPIWKELLASEFDSSTTLRNKSLCKIIRFKMHGKDMNIGQGSTSNLEITNQYFYLKP